MKSALNTFFFLNFFYKYLQAVVNQHFKNINRLYFVYFFYRLNVSTLLEHDPKRAAGHAVILPLTTKMRVSKRGVIILILHADIFGLFCYFLCMSCFLLISRIGRLNCENTNMQIKNTIDFPLTFTIASNWIFCSY